MRAIFFAVVLAVSSCRVVSASSTKDEPQCAFADESFTTMLAISSAVTEYYVAHHTWPSTTDQLRAQLLQSARSGPPLAATPTKKDVDQFFGRFSRVELQPRGRDLVLAVAYRAAGKHHSYRMLIHPGRNTEEMLQASTEIK